jgi:hypothetical protein
MNESDASARMDESQSAPANSPQSSLHPRRHNWGEKTIISQYKSERECLNNCGIVKAKRFEYENGHARHWVEYWRGLDLVSVKLAPVCEAL